MEVVCRRTTRSSESRTTEETGQVAASRRAGAVMRRRCSASPTLPAFANKSAAELGALGLALHDAQSVIAREHGFASWNACAKKSRRARCRSTRRSTSSSAARPAAPGPRRAAARAASRASPRRAPHRARARRRGGSRGAVARRIRSSRRSRVARRTGSRCSTCATPACTATRRRVDGLVAIARRLCSLGANPNAEYHWNWHPELPRTALWAAICAVSTCRWREVLLEAGANPTDGVTVHIAGGGGNSRRSSCCIASAST